MTALEWLLNQWPILESKIPIRILEEALEMEKQQIMLAWLNGKINEQDFFSDHTGTIVRANCAEKYYNETYKPST